MAGSRKLDDSARKAAQTELHRLLARLNRAFGSGIRSAFEITLGDEFEGLIDTSAAETVIPELLWIAEIQYRGPALRTGIGLGRVFTDARGSIREQDGPAFHLAREAIRIAKIEEKLGGVFLGFGEAQDAILNGIARGLHLQRAGWSRQQAAVALYLRNGKTQTDAASAMNVSKQAVSAYARAAHWRAYAEQENALRIALAWASAQQGNEGSKDRSQV